ncbi:MAG: KpsF/GutQ family sugar-phosphate isomerase [Candidatus Schekmanbacteria bacterium]|nr:KpsF/GutQ family sugar-phosphate isomerase [Candidatus Schekmanbacteria bacterium]
MNESLTRARQVLQIEARAIEALIPRLDHRFETAVRILYECRGRVIVTGMGKSGLIAKKVAATLASTGTPALFLHPGDAVHGDLGMVMREDAVVALSHSGETAELLNLLAVFKRWGVFVIVLTGCTTSTMAKFADVVLDVSIEQEACPLGLAPSASTTAALALGDALALTILERRGFGPEEFANFHPGGRLGRRLLRVRDLAHWGEALPVVPEAAPMRDVLVTITEKSLGMTVVVDGDGKLSGIITDGDLRRAIRQSEHEGARPLLELPASAVMSRRPKLIDADVLAAEAVPVMDRYVITALVIADELGRPWGVLKLQDLIREGII